jgi:hypothetical protein
MKVAATTLLLLLLLVAAVVGLPSLATELVTTCCGLDLALSTMKNCNVVDSDCKYKSHPMH